MKQHKRMEKNVKLASQSFLIPNCLGELKLKGLVHAACKG